MSIYARRLQRNIGEKVEKVNNEESQNTLQVICKFPGWSLVGESFVSFKRN